MKLGIVGLPDVGKSALFNAITKAGAEMVNYPFYTIDPNIGLANVPDERVHKLVELFNPKKIVPVTTEFYDIAGLIKGVSKGEGLGNKFLENIRESDAIVEALRCFEDKNIVHVDGSVDPIRDIETINYGLILSDLEIVERRLEKFRKALKGNKDLKEKVDLFEKIYEVLSEEKSIRILDLDESEMKLMRSFSLLSVKPVIYVRNVSKDEVADAYDNNEMVQKVKEFTKSEDAKVVVISAQIESEISALDSEEDKKEFLEAIGLEKSGIDDLITQSYDLLGFTSFLTTGEDETRAWTIKKNTPTVQATGKIHTDIQRGFVRTETVNYDDSIELKPMIAIGEKGLMRLGGKEYLMQDGDVVHFRFSV